MSNQFEDKEQEKYFNEFQSENIDDEMLFLADSESLLDYANNLNSDMNMSYLDFHYRSKHPKLINFSNAAFYESRLVPMPAKKEYKPIEYYDINGKYSGRKNDDEADKIVEYIFSDNVVMDNKILSVGIVTLNSPKRSPADGTIISALSPLVCVILIINV